MWTLSCSIGCVADNGRIDLELIAALAAAPIDRFEIGSDNLWGDYDGTVARRLRVELEAVGKRAYSFHLPYRGLDVLSAPDPAARELAVSRAQVLIAQAEALGAALIVAHPSPPGMDEVSPELRCAAMRQSLAELGRGTGLKIAVENLCGPERCGGTVEKVAAILSGFDQEQFGICLDVNHLCADHLRLPQQIAALGTRLFHLHVSDFGGAHEQHWMPGAGVIDWRALLAALRAVDYSGSFNYELKLREGVVARRLAGIAENHQALLKL